MKPNSWSHYVGNSVRYGGTFSTCSAEPLLNTDWAGFDTFFTYISVWLMILTHRRLVTLFGAIELGQHWLTGVMQHCLMEPIHYPNQCWLIITWTITIQFPWKRKHISDIFIHGNVACISANILSTPQCINDMMTSSKTAAQISHALTARSSLFT